MSLYAVIMAGGSGTRFWPLSRRRLPKQFLAIGTERSLLQATVARLDPLVGLERVYTVAGPTHTDIIRRLLPALPAHQMIVEPFARNTAPCVGLAAVHLRRRDPEAVMAVLPADHHIGDVPRFQQALGAAELCARRGDIVTLGLPPSRPETGYGYIHFDPEDRTDVAGVGVCGVRRFVEKPDRAVAEGYLAEGGYLWNSGIFVLSARRVLDEIEAQLPALHQALQRVTAALDGPDYEPTLRDAFEPLAGISLDYGIMEGAGRIRVIPTDIGWNDVGHWAALPDFAPADATGNVIAGAAMVIDSRGCVVQALGGRLVAVVGVDDLVVVDTPDALLVCPKEKAQAVRQIVARLQQGDPAVKDLPVRDLL